MKVSLICIGMWIFSDAIYSWTSHLNAPGYEGSPRQTFKRDHWIRLVRAICGITIVVFGATMD